MLEAEYGFYVIEPTQRSMEKGAVICDMATYSLTENPAYIRKSVFAFSNPDLEKRYDYMYSPSTYQVSPLAGFVFAPGRIESEIVIITALSNELQLTISKYGAAEAVTKINNWHAEYI